jgi:Ion channel
VDLLFLSDALYIDGHLQTPETPVFQLYTIFFIFIGIATLTIMVAQVYQCIALEASRAQHSRDQSELARRGMDMLIKTTMLGTVGSSSPTSSLHAAASAAAQGGAGVGGVQRRLSQDDHDMVGISIPPVPWIDRVFRLLERIKIFFVTNEFGRSISVLFPFAGLILIGAIVIGPIEGWTPIESIYFAVVSLTTVGFGDYYPTRTASVWFCIVWLPFSIGFMSLFLANVAAFYIRLSDKNIERIERHLRRRIARAKLDAEREKREARRRALRGQEPRRPPASIEMGAATSSAETGRGSFDTDEDSNHDMDDSNHSGSSGGGSRERDLISAQANWTRRDRVLHNSRARAEEGRKMDGNDSDDSEETIQPRGSRMATMKAVLETVYANMSHASSNAFRYGPDSEFLSIRSNQKLYKHSLRDSTLRKPSFALRVLVQERLAEIIATEIAGNQNNVEIKDNTLIVTISLLKQAADKWLIPRRARKAFRSVSFEVLYFVGEHGLITRGADALYEDLTPFEFHGLFAPFLAALGDAETMETWLSSTEMLAEVDLRGRDTPSPIQMASQSGKLQQQQQQPPRRDEHKGATGRTRQGGRRKHDLNASVDSTEDLPDGHYRPVVSDKHDHTIV